VAAGASEREDTREACRFALYQVRRIALWTEALVRPRDAPRLGAAERRSLVEAVRRAESLLTAVSMALQKDSEAAGAAISPREESTASTRMRRIAALLAWIDQEHRFSAEAAEGEPPFFIDAVHLDVYAEILDSSDWRTVVRPSGRAFYAHLAAELVRALEAPETEEHLNEVQTLRRASEA
jgi:hypothetical protein